MNTKPNLDQRRARPQTLASAFGGLLKIFGAGASDADLSTRWNEIVGGDFATKTALVGTRRGADKKLNITIRSTVPAFAMELSYRSDELRAKINKYFGYDAVGKITIRK